MKKYILLIWLCGLIGIAHAQVLQEFSGVVLDNNGTGIPGTTIYLLNTNFGAPSDNQGRFSIQNIPSGEYQVRFSAVGYATTTRTITLPGNNTELVIQLVAANKQLEEVTVTAQKREENLQRVPFSISALSSRKVQEYRLWNSRDITAIVPNLYSADPGDNRNLTSIRGITTTSYDPAVATYIDGVNQFGLDTYIAELLDIERIEVLRGPQGTLYGRNAMGGVINIITKQPTNQTSGFAEINLGNYGQQRYSAGIRTPLVKNKLFLGASGLFRKQTGFYTNLFNNSDFDQQHVSMGNYYLKYLANDRLNLTLNVKHSANRNEGTFPVVSSPEEAFANPFELNQNSVGKMIDNTTNSSLSVNYAGRAFNFSSQTAYQANYRYYNQPIDGDFSPIDAVSIVNNYGSDWNKVRVGTQEFRFTSPASTQPAFNWIASAYGFYNDNPVKQGTHFGADAKLVGAPFPNFTSININNGQSYGGALYGQITYQLLPKLDLTAGLRYDYERRKQSIRGEFQPDGEAAIVSLPDTASKASFKAFSPKASLSYHLAESNTIYFTYSRGFRAGGFTQLSSDPSQPPLYAYKPEYSNNFEVGLKNTFLENRLRLNITGFYTKVTDVQIPTLVLPEALVITRNAGKLTSKGAELELTATPVNGLELAYNLGYTNAKYTDLVLAQNGEQVTLNGSRQIFTPDITSMLAAQYGYELGSSQKIRLIARGEWRYLGNQYFDLANQLKQEAYSVFNARLGLAARRAEVFVWGRNLGDKRYLDYAYNFGAARLGNPRTYGVSVRVNF
ncbi:TonB-dependent receptor [Adhaeribacter aerolatus]|uniref:TonB-dependent receptor n=1 Tax=Adhaeribacter aerolatus TaxID=670289 RepID=A0A512B1R5_9BACT|nr:TonB-dependent receptor [Adhaeribacter aerolatus]GEO05901.1 TonB-dependent receptor [Adhaeribacter aerolatus]